DVEAGATFNDTWRFALDENLVPLASDIPEPIGYQAFKLTLGANSQPPTFTSATVPPTAGNGGTIQLTINGLADAESDPLTVEVDWDNDGTYTVHGPYTSPYTNPLVLTSPITYTYMGPGTDTRSLPVRVKDAQNTVPVTPTLTFQVSPCGADNWMTTPFSLPGFNNTSNGYSPPYTDTAVPANNIGTADFATLRFGFSSGFRGVLQQHLKLFNATPPAGQPQATSEINRINLPTGSVHITSFGNNTWGRQFHQIEVDSTNRVLFAMKISDTTSFSPPSSVYPAGTGADVDIKYFDYTGAVVPWTSVQTISTGGNRVVALALDQSNNVYMVDTNNVLHKYLRASSYAEDTTAPYPIDLKAAPLSLTLTGSGAGEKKIHDFIVDWRTGSFFFLVQTQEPATAPGNGYIYRLDCDGYHPTVNGNPNPYRMVLNNSTTQAIPADIFADQIDGSG
ncbi:MAG TPA: hypothetical protein VEI97_17360, partial [bacterium]|nr:hypothetical protein [bacterium]